MKLKLRVRPELKDEGSPHRLFFLGTELLDKQTLSSYDASMFCYTQGVVNRRHFDYQVASLGRTIQSCDRDRAW
jgi:hypothetical protein